jgi:hypothetical protein
MRDDARKAALDGVGYGLVAGMIFAVAQLVVAMHAGNALLPLRMSASVILGASALDALSVGATAVVGLGVHLVLSALFGLAYGLLDGNRPQEPERSPARQAGFGTLYGLALWLIDFQLIGRLTHPWFLGAPQLGQAMLHSFFFGLPLALMYVQRARHARPIEMLEAA